VATGVTRVREWQSGVRAEAQEIKETEGTQESCRGSNAEE
jgi:hypothetical protein